MFLKKHLSYRPDNFVIFVSLIEPSLNMAMALSVYRVSHNTSEMSFRSTLDLHRCPAVHVDTSLKSPVPPQK